MDDLLKFKIGIGDFVSFEEIIPEGPLEDFKNGEGFLVTWINIRAGAFNGAIKAHVRIDDFKRFQSQLKILYRTVEGEAHFSCLEDWIDIKIKGDGIGHFNANCVANDNTENRNELHFSLLFDQTDLKESLHQLNQIIAEFE